MTRPVRSLPAVQCTRTGVEPLSAITEIAVAIVHAESVRTWR